MKSTFFSGEGWRGVLKGCAAEVDVAAGVECGRGLVAVVVWAVTAALARREGVWEKVRLLGREEVVPALRRAARRRQRWQSIVGKTKGEIEWCSDDVPVLYTFGQIAFSKGRGGGRWNISNQQSKHHVHHFFPQKTL